MKKVADPARPIDPAIWSRAAQIAATYSLVIEPEAGVGYLGRTVELPLAMSDGETVAQCAANVIEATTLAVAAMLENNERPPIPAREGRRDQQLNIRVSAEEKMRLESAANSGGYRSVSDYLREAGLGRARSSG
ncbi:MAG TPA: type II toxin-antitoxin system HicB family antitoxin [Phycisphaerales bacterium]|nr:type II toxin-antitoxin system HicB family antitoxin [Phycisphaerales bacterium]